MHWDALRAKELREKDDALNANAALRLQLESLVESQRFEVRRIESEASKASDFAERFEAQQELANSSAEELKQAAHDRARLHSEFASAEAALEICIHNYIYMIISTNYIYIIYLIIYIYIFFFGVGLTILSLHNSLKVWVMQA